MTRRLPLKRRYPTTPVTRRPRLTLTLTVDDRFSGPQADAHAEFARTQIIPWLHTTRNTPTQENP